MSIDASEGGNLARFVTDELPAFFSFGIPQHGFAQLCCDIYKARHIVVICGKGRGFCPSGGGRRMNEGAPDFIDYVLPDALPLRQWVLMLPIPLTFALAFNGRLLGNDLRIFTDTVATCAFRGAACCKSQRPLLDRLTSAAPKDPRKRAVSKGDRSCWRKCRLGNGVIRGNCIVVGLPSGRRNIGDGVSCAHECHS